MPAQPKMNIVPDDASQTPLPRMMPEVCRPCQYPQFLDFPNGGSFYQGTHFPACRDLILPIYYF